jgi:glutathione synthase/RimK-type ligase-like ATP-grasp enzyme
MIRSRSEVISMDSCCILNGGAGAWAFAALADQLSRALWVDVSEVPRRVNYLLHADGFDRADLHGLFVPNRAMELAADKRRLAAAFTAAEVPIPETRLVGSLAEAEALLAEHPGREWCLKFPTGCGASGHCRLAPGLTLSKNWPLPLVVQEFIRLDPPEVYRSYAAGGRSFGWVVRRFPDGSAVSPWVAHAQGARYEGAGEAPADATAAARAALEAIELLESFGCVDLLRRPTGEWVVLEVRTDGMFNHVDRDLGLPGLESEIQRRVAEAFWSRLGEWRPWGDGGWRPRQAVAA